MKTLISLFLILLNSTPIQSHSVESWAYEDDLLNAVDFLLAKDKETTISNLEKLTKSYPDSRLVSLIYADILGARGGLAPVIDKKMVHLDRDIVSELRKQLYIRWHYWNTITNERQARVPDTLLKLSNIQNRALYMDVPSSRLIVYEEHNGIIKELISFYASIGIAGPNKQLEGDRKTPTGVYRIMGFIPGEKLHERYGPGALLIDYPNKFDLLKRRTGSGIWIHGTEPGFINRAPQASDGCLSLANKDFLVLVNLIESTDSVPLVIDPSPSWVNRAELVTRRDLLTEAVEKWLQEHGTSSLSILRSTYLKKSHTSLSLMDLQIFGYPGETNVYVADLLLKESHNYTLAIRQFWKFTPSHDWTIIDMFPISDN